MLSTPQARQLLAVVVPVYFPPEIEAETIGRILEGTFTGSDLFSAPEKTLVVVDRGSRAEDVLKAAARGSPLHGLPLRILEENRGKAGAVETGLAWLLEHTDACYLVTRDCDGDHAAEDLVRMVNLAEHMRADTGRDLISIFGVRASLKKPMGWRRQEWEHLTNAIFQDLAEFLLARQGKVLDRRYWNGYPLDAQSGYRLYTRLAARRAIHCLAAVPQQPQLQTFACEILPFLDLAVEGALFGQVQRLALVEQPVSSYRRVSLSTVYGALLAYAGDCYQIPAATLLQMVDNHVVESSLYFSPERAEVLEFRRHLAADASPPLHPRFV